MYTGRSTTWYIKYIKERVREFVEGRGESIRVGKETSIIVPPHLHCAGEEYDEKKKHANEG